MMCLRIICMDNHACKHSPAQKLEIFHNYCPREMLLASKPKKSHAHSNMMNASISSSQLCEKFGMNGDAEMLNVAWT